MVVLGWSDDLTEFEGAICDEVGCLDGNDIYVSASGTIANNEEAAFDSFVPDAHPEFALIVANWEPGGYSWVYETDIPHESFDGESCYRGTYPDVSYLCFVRKRRSTKLKNR